jgi:predicted dehydrogenase
MRAVLVGCGAQSEVWLHAVRENPNVQLVGYVDLNIDAARRRGEPAGTDLAEMLRRVKPDAVFDCTVPAAHKSVTLTAFEHGCHVLGEKPIADSMENARAMVEAARRARRIYAVTQNRRYDPRIRRLKKLLPGLGTLTTINSDFYIGAHFGGFRDQMAHPLLLDMSIHTMDAARFLSGADPVAVYCKAWNPKGSWYAGDAAAVAIFEMTGGIVYTYRGSWCSEGVHTSW